MPAVLPCRRVERENRGGEKVVAGTRGGKPVRCGVAGGEVEQPELRVDCGCLPDGCAAVLPGVAGRRPRVMADLAGTGNRVEAPVFLAGLGIEGGEPAADSELAARDAGVDASVVIEGCAGDRVSLLIAADLRRPIDVTRRLVECDELAVELADVDLAVAERNAS